jgi:hypothetical protein
LDFRHAPPHLVHLLYFAGLGDRAQDLRHARHSTTQLHPHPRTWVFNQISRLFPLFNQEDGGHHQKGSISIF